MEVEGLVFTVIAENNWQTDCIIEHVDVDSVLWDCWVVVFVL